MLGLEESVYALDWSNNVSGSSAACWKGIIVLNFVVFQLQSLP